MRRKYKSALYIAAEAAYESEVIDTGMRDILIGEEKDFESRKDWIEERVQEWLDAAEAEAK